MFIREIVSKNKKYLAIIETYRVNGKVKHKCIGSLGCVDNLNPESLENMARTLLKYCKNNKKSLFDISTSIEKSRKKWGCVEVYKKIWDMFGLDDMLSGITNNRNISFDYFSAMFLMVLDRLIDPKSKLGCYNRQERYYGIKSVELHHLYRSLDILSEKKEEIERYLFERNKNLFNMEVDVVLYDVTTLYFESEREDVLREFGFSKDMKVNEVQIVLGLLVDMEGRPIGFDIFGGRVFEGKTLKKVLNKVSNNFGIRKVILVTDRGMLSRENIEEIKGLGYEYVIGSRIKNKSKEIKEEILKEEGYRRIRNEEGEVFRYKELEERGGERLICVWSKNRAEKDKRNRERLIELAEKVLEGGDSKVFPRRGYRRYIRYSKLGCVLDKEKIEEEARWDGYYGIQTNNDELKGEKILECYRNLWKIEECFRTLKSHMKARPMFHWTPKRIKGHMVLCFIAFLLERTLEIELRRNNIKVSPEKIREALSELELSEIKIEDRDFILRSEIKGLANDIFRILKIKIPSRVRMI